MHTTGCLHGFRSSLRRLLAKVTYTLDFGWLLAPSTQPYHDPNVPISQGPPAIPPPLCHSLHLRGSTFPEHSQHRTPQVGIRTESWKQAEQPSDRVHQTPANGSQHLIAGQAFHIAIVPPHPALSPNPQRCRPRSRQMPVRRLSICDDGNCCV
jgi:hypothetical protein